MRTSILSRSVVAVASLAIGSTALATTPATAATASGITRDQILSAATGYRTAYATDTSVPLASSRALRAIIIDACDVSETDGETISGELDMHPVTTPSGADGFLASTTVISDFSGGRDCTFAAVAAIDDLTVLSGWLSLDAVEVTFDEDDQITRTPISLTAVPLSGDAVVTPGIDPYASDRNVSELSASASGGAAWGAPITMNEKIPDKKTTAEKKKAKKTYSKRLKSAKKAYAKALDKAGRSKRKKAAAKALYSSRRSTAKATYRKQIADYRWIKVSRTNYGTPVPFSITTRLPESGLPMRG